MKRLALAFAALVVVATSAFADTATPNGFTATWSTATAITMTSGGAPGGLSASDGTYAGFSFFGPAGANAVTLVVTASFSASNLPGDELTVVLSEPFFNTGAGTSSATLATLQWYDPVLGGGTTLTYNPGTLLLGVSTPLGAGSTKYAGTNFGAIPVGFNPTQLIMTFNIVTNGGGELFVIDMVSNPEPGTMALFGLGALGLGGVAWRRRRAAKAKKAAEASVA